MGWLIAYLVSTVVVPGFYGAFMLDHDSKIVLNGGESCLFLIIICFGWPLFFPFDAYEKGTKAHRKYVVDKAERIVSKNGIGHDRFDRSNMVAIPEKDLKFALRAYRRKYIELSPSTAEIIREELMHRMTERSLLG
jgi:hypothetical protein